jgi:hypothetical protein
MNSLRSLPLIGAEGAPGGNPKGSGTGHRPPASHPSVLSFLSSPSFHPVSSPASFESFASYASCWPP